jgi:hypothetical protein
VKSDFTPQTTSHFRLQTSKLPRLVTALRHAIRVLVKSPGVTTLIEHLLRRMVVGQALRLESIGLGLGLIGALAAARMLDRLLFGVSANDPVTLLASAPC